jgi:hypothetical protein
VSAFLGALAGELWRAVEPLEESLADEDAFELLLERLGWDVAVDPSSLAAIRGAFELVELFEAAREVIQQIDDAGDPIILAGELLDVLIAVIETIRGLEGRPPGSLPFPLNEPDFRSQTLRELLDLLFVQYLETHKPLLFGPLLVLGLIEIEEVFPTGAGRLPYLRHRLHWDRLKLVVSEPDTLFRQVYHWNDPATLFDHQRLLRALERSLLAARMAARYTYPRQERLDTYYDPANSARPDIRELAAPLLSGPTGLGFVELGLLALPIPPRSTPGGPPDGLFLTPLAVGYGGTAIDLGTGFSLELTGGFEADGAIGLELYPDEVNVEVADTTVVVDTRAALVGRPETPLIVMGAPESHRLEIGEMMLSTGVRGPADDLEVVVELSVSSAPESPRSALVLQAEEGDGFVQRILGTQPIRLELGGGLIWSSKTGLMFGSRQGISITIPINKTIGASAIADMTLGLRPVGSGVALVVMVTAAAQFGPINVAAENIGVALVLTPKAPGEPPGTFGDLDVAFGYKPPDGAGLAIDTGAVVGAGFLSYDPALEQYAGILVLEVNEAILLRAVGIVTTRLPDGSKGFALLVIISAEGFAPIQLGLGFALTGVGGLLGVHRTVVVDVLRAGLATGALDAILFPDDPLRDVPRFVSDLARVFPPAEGRFVFGPMASISWGTPPLVEAEIGVILELPAPMRLVVLGQVNALLPRRDLPIVELHLDVLGIVDFDQRRLSIDGVLHHSYLAAFSLSGDMALRLAWGAEPSFALAVGGLHPSFPVPSGFPALRRLTLALGADENPRLTFQAYLALTSNTVQVGARVELYAEAAGFNLYGWLGFDALFVLSPFAFAADLSAGIALRRGTSVIAGIHLDATLSGPTPWHVVGEATLTVLLFEVSIAFDVTFGQGRRVELPPTDPRPLLLAALGDPRNWSGLAPASTTRLVLLAAPSSDQVARVDPGDGVAVRQTVVPLNRRLTRFGPVGPVGPDRYRVDAVTVGGQALTSWSAVDDQFAPAQFEALTDAQKLGRPSFERMEAGIAIADGAVAVGAAMAAPVVYETVVVGADGASRPSPTYRPSRAHQLAKLRQGIGVRAPLRTSGTRKFAPARRPTSRAVLVDERFAIAATLDLSPRPDIGERLSRGEAELRLADHLAAHPRDRGRLQVVPLHELETVA